MRKDVANLILAVVTLSVLVACGGGDSSTPPVSQLPPSVDTDLNWDDGNWDEEDWQ